MRLYRRTASFWAAVLMLWSTSAHSASAERLETAVLAGGCFWGMEGVFEHVRGVKNVVSGYAGGTRTRITGPGVHRSGFAEAVRIRFDPRQVSYAKLLEIYFTVAHDPTELNRQGPDVGPRYRSAVFPQTGEQKIIAQQMIDKLRSSGRFPKPITTRLESGSFDVAEAAHQDYVRKHPTSRYVVVNDLPKLAKLERTFAELWREQASE